MREHKGWLYLGGIFNNRLGQIRLAGADPSWTTAASYWGAQLMVWLQRRVNAFRGSGECAATVPPMDGALQPETGSNRLPSLARRHAPTISRAEPLACVSSGNECCGSP